MVRIFGWALTGGPPLRGVGIFFIKRAHRIRKHIQLSEISMLRSFHLPSTVSAHWAISTPEPEIERYHHSLILSFEVRRQIKTVNVVQLGLKGPV
jgi:hypothetical protein